MKMFFFFSYLIFLAFFLRGAWIWARKKRRQTRALRNPSGMQTLFFSDLEKDWYVSYWFCLGFALVTFIAGAIVRAVVW